MPPNSYILSVMAVTAAPGFLLTICFAKKGLRGWGREGLGKRPETGESDNPCLTCSWQQVSAGQGAACYRDPWEPCRGMAMPWVRSRKASRRDWHLHGALMGE